MTQGLFGTVTDPVAKPARGRRKTASTKVADVKRRARQRSPAGSNPADNPVAASIGFKRGYSHSSSTNYGTTLKHGFGVRICIESLEDGVCRSWVSIQVDPSEKGNPWVLVTPMFVGSRERVLEFARKHARLWNFKARCGARRLSTPFVVHL